MLYVGSKPTIDAAFVKCHFRTMVQRDNAKVSNVHCFGTTKLTLVCVLRIERFCANLQKNGHCGQAKNTSRTAESLRGIRNDWKKGNN